ncbi:MAG: hypothetical protein ACI8RZ_006461 [Myxococcota bacterium]|jgi:hypothetical protein
MSDYTNIATHERGRFLVCIIQHGGRFYADICKRGQRVKQTLYQDTSEGALVDADRWLDR